MAVFGFRPVGHPTEAKPRGWPSPGLYDTDALHAAIGGKGIEKFICVVW